MTIDNHDIRKTEQMKLLGVKIDQISTLRVIASYVRELIKK